MLNIFDLPETDDKFLNLSDPPGQPEPPPPPPPPPPNPKPVKGNGED